MDRRMRLAVARTLLRVAKFLYEPTMWIAPGGKVHELRTHTHFDWIARNFDRLFPDAPDEAWKGGDLDMNYVFDYPIRMGWVRVRVTHRETVIEGSRTAVKRQGNLLMDIIMAASQVRDKYFVSIGSGDERPKQFVLPADWGRLEKFL